MEPSLFPQRSRQVNNVSLRHSHTQSPIYPSPSDIPAPVTMSMDDLSPVPGPLDFVTKRRVRPSCGAIEGRADDRSVRDSGHPSESLLGRTGRIDLEKRTEVLH